MNFSQFKYPFLQNQRQLQNQTQQQSQHHQHQRQYQTQPHLQHSQSRYNSQQHHQDHLRNSQQGSSRSSQSSIGPQQPIQRMTNPQYQPQGGGIFRGQGESSKTSQAYSPNYLSQGHQVMKRGDRRMTFGSNQTLKENVPPPSSSIGDGSTSATSSSSSSRRMNTSSNMRVFSCRVSKLKEWSNSSSSTTPVIYRVHGRLVNIRTETGSKRQTKKKTLTIEDIVDSSQKVNCFFQEIDRQLDPVKVGEFVVATGRLIGSKEECSLQIFSLDVFALDQVQPYLARMENFALRAMKLK